MWIIVAVLGLVFGVGTAGQTRATGTGRPVLLWALTAQAVGFGGLFLICLARGFS